MSRLVQCHSAAGLDLRAPLYWLDPPSPTISAAKRQHDLDLTVSSPHGDHYTMRGFGVTDSANNNERVIVPSAFLFNGVRTVTVSSKALLTETRGYSLVETGAITDAKSGN